MSENREIAIVDRLRRGCVWHVVQEKFQDGSGSMTIREVDDTSTKLLMLVAADRIELLERDNNALRANLEGARMACSALQDKIKVARDNFECIRAMCVSLQERINSMRDQNGTH